MPPDLEDFDDRLVSGMSDAIIYADAEGVIRRWNRGATRIFGFTETDALGQSLDIPSVAVDGIVGPVTWQALVSGMLSF